MVLENNHLICLCWPQRRQKWCCFLHVFHRQVPRFLELQVLVPLWKVPWICKDNTEPCDKLLMTFTWSQCVPKLAVPSPRDVWPVLWVYPCVQLGDTYHCKAASSFLYRTCTLDFLFFFPVTFHKLWCLCRTEYSTGWKSLHQIVLSQSCWWILRDVDCANLHG